MGIGKYQHFSITLIGVCGIRAPASVCVCTTPGQKTIQKPKINFTLFFCRFVFATCKNNTPRSNHPRHNA